jgi:hypothetical protein
MTPVASLQLGDRLPAVVPRALGRLEAAARRLRARPELPVLDRVHPEAAIGTRVDLGVHAIAVDEIRGTAVGGPRLRGADFKPVDDLRTGAWRDRYQRLRTAFDRMVALPPIEVIEAGGGYWVVDGHNRVALAREKGLAYLDADVTGIRWPGGPVLHSPLASLGAVLEAGAQQRAAASDRWSGTAAGVLSQRSAWRPALGDCLGACA